MANQPTRFSGPVVYSGKGINNSFFENLPIGCNPDYVTFMDDFITSAIDTDKWDTETLSSGTIGLLGGATSGDDIPYGWAKAGGSGTTADSGAGLQLNETIQGIRKHTTYFEVSVALLDADKSNLFVGLSLNGTLSTALPFDSNNRIGFQVDTGSAEIKCVTRKAANTDTTSTGIDFVDYTLDNGFGSGGYVHDSRRLGFRWTNPSEAGSAFNQQRVDFFVDRALVATHINVTDSTSSVPNGILSPWWAFTQGSGVAAVSDSALDYMFVVSSREAPENGTMTAFGSPR